MTIYSNSLEPARCKLCGSRILWARTFPNRKRAPLDSPLRTANIAYDSDGHEIAELMSSTHFESCQNYQPNVAAVPKIQQPKLF